MVVEECTPCLRRWFVLLRHEPRDCSLADIVSKLEQLTVNTGGAPVVLLGHLPDQCPHFGVGFWASSSVAAFPGPEQFEALAVPVYDCLWFYDD